MHISVISCPNGMGHFYRLIDIAKVLSKNNKIYFFCSKKQMNKLKCKLKNIDFIPILKNLNIEEKKIDFLINFYNQDLTKIKKINISKIIISDNLINKIYLKKKFILISNFYWGKNFQLKSKEYKIYQDLEKKFLKNNTILQNRYFGHSYNSNFKKKLINFTGSKIKSNNKIKKKKIFFFFRKKMKIFPIFKFLQSKYEIYSNKPLKKYDIKYHDLNMGLHQFIFLLARPGFGSISDSVKFQIPILSYVEKNETKEIIINNKLIKKYKIGISLNKNTIGKLLNINHNLSEYKEYLNNLNKFRFDGEVDIVDYVKKI